MLQKKLCRIENDDNDHQYLIVSEPAINPNGYFCILVLNLSTGSLKTVKCEYVTIIGDSESNANR